MDKIKEQIEKIVEKIKKDPDFKEEFMKDPEKAIEKVTGIERPRRSAGTRNGRFLSPSKRYTPLCGRVIQTLSRPINGHTPRKLPSQGCNLPLHRILRVRSPHSRHVRITESPLIVKRGFPVFSSFLPKIFEHFRE